MAKLYGKSKQPQLRFITAELHCITDLCTGQNYSTWPDPARWLFWLGTVGFPAEIPDPARTISLTLHQLNVHHHFSKSRVLELTIMEWVSSCLTAHQHNIGHSVPWVIMTTMEQSNIIWNQISLLGKLEYFIILKSVCSLGLIQPSLACAQVWHIKWRCRPTIPRGCHFQPFPAVTTYC